MSKEIDKQFVWTKQKHFGFKIYLESSGDNELDEALRTLFVDAHNRTAPLEMTRPDVQVLQNRGVI